MRQRATYDDLVKLPEHLVGEIINGELIVSPRPASAHGRTSSTMGGDLTVFDRPPDGGPGGWWIFDEPELHFGQDVLVPDLAGWRRERMPKLKNVPFFELPPDWVCEVASPSTERLDRSRKMAVYAKVKIPHLWIVTPLARVLEVYRLDGTWRLAATHAGDDKARAEPFDAIELDLSRWWLEPETE